MGLVNTGRQRLPIAYTPALTCRVAAMSKNWRRVTQQRSEFYIRPNASELVREQISLRHILGMVCNCRLEQFRTVVLCGIHQGRNLNSRHGWRISFNAFRS